MYSLDFPNLFKSAGTNLLSDKEAAISNLHLILSSEKGGLFGDPRFGSHLKEYLFEQNSVVTRDLIIDELYMIIQKYVPQIRVKRSDIIITSSRESVIAEITCTYMHNKETDMFSIDLTEE